MRPGLAILSAAALVASVIGAHAEKNYGPGVSDTEIKLGQTQPYSGPVSAASVTGKAMTSYFNMINAQGGINGRKINLISLDDGFTPPRTLEQTRRLVESDNVLALVGSLGSPTNAVVQRYLNDKKVPQLFVIAGATKFSDPKNFPYTVPFYSPYSTEARAYANYILQNKPDAKIAIIYQNDDFGKDFLQSFKAGLGEKAARMIVGEASFETTDPTLDSQIITLYGSGADTLLNFATQKFGAQAVRKQYDIGWRPLHFVNVVSSSVAGVLQQAGLDKSVGLITGVLLKDPATPVAAGTDKDLDDFYAFMKRWYPDGSPNDSNIVWGYLNAELTALVLRRCGDDLTRENLMKQTTALKDVELPMLRKGVRVTISPDNYVPFNQLQLARFDGKVWVPFGEVINAAGK